MGSMTKHIAFRLSRLSARELQSVAEEFQPGDWLQLRNGSSVNFGLFFDEVDRTLRFDVDYDIQLEAPRLVQVTEDQLLAVDSVIAAVEPVEEEEVDGGRTPGCQLLLEAKQQERHAKNGRSPRSSRFYRTTSLLFGSPFQRNSRDTDIELMPNCANEAVFNHVNSFTTTSVAGLPEKVTP